MSVIACIMLLVGMTWLFSPVDCCDPDTVDCGCCCDANTALEDIIVDFGVGGLTDDECDACDQLAGEFTLANSSTFNCCAWTYDQDPWCTTNIDHANCDVSCPDEQVWRLNITMNLEESGGVCRWRCVLLFDWPLPGDEDCTDATCPAITMEAVYIGNTGWSTGETDDCSQEVTLTLDSSTLGANNQVCGGSFPATITVN